MGSGGCAGGEGGKLRVGWGLQGAMGMRLRGCSVGGDGAGNEVGVVSAGDGGDGEGVGGGCDLAELTGVGSGGGAGGEG